MFSSYSPKLHITYHRVGSFVSVGWLILVLDEVHNYNLLIMADLDQAHVFQLSSTSCDRTGFCLNESSLSFFNLWWEPCDEDLS